MQRHKSGVGLVTGSALLRLTHYTITRAMRIGTGAAGALQYRELGVLLVGGWVRLEHFNLLLELHDVGSERLTSQ